MKIFGQPTITMSVTSQAAFGTGNVEIVFALDTTGSMSSVDPGTGHTKLADAQVAASNLIDTIFSAPSANSRVKVGFVPFNYYVNVGLAYRGAAWLTNTNDYTGPAITPACYPTYPNIVYGAVIHHADPYLNDGVPAIYNWDEYPVVSYGAPGPNQCDPPWSPTYTWSGVVGSRSALLDQQETVGAANPVSGIYNFGLPPQPLQRLTNNPALIKSQINSTTAGGETYIAPGLLWGWRVLSPFGPFADGASYSPATKKIMILMTDGANTHSPNYPDHEGGDVTSGSGANAITSSTCTSIRTAGIEIYTVAFAVTDLTIKSILQGCASDSAHYFDAGTSAAMMAAFQQIGANMTALRLTQ